MSKLMDLVAGDATDILMVIGLDDLAALDDPRPLHRRTSRSEAGSTRPGSTSSPRRPGRSPVRDEPTDFIDARLELDAPRPRRTDDRAGRPARGSRPSPMIPDHHLGAIAGRWIDLVEDEIGVLPREEKPWIRDLAGRHRGVLPGG